MPDLTGDQSKLVRECLEENLHNPIGPQVKLVSIVDGGSVTISSVVLYVVSKLISDILSEVPFLEEYTMTLLVPVKLKVIKQLLTLVSTGEVKVESKGEVISIEQAATHLLGIRSPNVTLDEVEDGETYGNNSKIDPEDFNLNSSDITEKYMKVGKFSCHSCDRTFPSQCVYYYHMDSVKHRQWARHLLEYNKGHPGQYQLITNENIEIKNREFICKLCNRKYNSSEAISNHVSKKHKEYIPFNYTCDVCKVGFFQDACFKAHQNSNKHKVRVDHKYELSEETWSETNVDKNKACKLNISMPTVNLKLFKMTEINTIINEHLNKNTQRKTRRKECVCRVCEATFKTQAKRNAHLDIIHGLNVSKKNCRICEVTFYGRPNRDYKIHLESKSHKIKGKQISITSSTKSEFQQVNDLMGEPNCGLCKKNFSSRNELSRHLMTLKHQVTAEADWEHLRKIAERKVVYEEAAHDLSHTFSPLDFVITKLESTPERVKDDVSGVEKTIESSVSLATQTKESSFNTSCILPITDPVVQSISRMDNTNLVSVYNELDNKLKNVAVINQLDNITVNKQVHNTIKTVKNNNQFNITTKTAFNQLENILKSVSVKTEEANVIDESAIKEQEITERLDRVEKCPEKNSPSVIAPFFVVHECSFTNLNKSKDNGKKKYGYSNSEPCRCRRLPNPIINQNTSHNKDSCLCPDGKMTELPAAPSLSISVSSTHSTILPIVTESSSLNSKFSIDNSMSVGQVKMTTVKFTINDPPLVKTSFVQLPADKHIRKAMRKFSGVLGVKVEDLGFSVNGDTLPGNRLAGKLESPNINVVKLHQ